LSAQKTYNLRAAADVLGVSTATVWRRVTTGELEAEKERGRWIIYEDAVRDYRQRRRYRRDGARNGERERTHKADDLADDEREILTKFGIEIGERKANGRE